MSLPDILSVVAAVILGAAAGPRISWAIRSWPGHEDLLEDYTKCHVCPGGLRRGCVNAGKNQDLAYLAFSAALAGLSVGIWGIGTKAVLSWVFGVSCMIITVVDVRFLIIPDKLSINGSWAGLAYALACWVWTSPLGKQPPQYYVTLTDSILGFLLGGGFLWALGWLAWKILKKEGMGGGDVKLLAAFGAWMGWKPVIAIVVLASLLGTIGGVGSIIYQKIRYHRQYKPLTHMIPFGPYLCVAFIFVFYCGIQPLLNIMDMYHAWVEAKFLHGR
ncbi:MAG TPA: A24 family peptidase [Candidatus Ozemobacteraceae bacterium]|nr:A24 family peptidase [Candidatus Ozemobacteraceae bacterium]HQG28362.1 A24 family peptidase [Candidatus Ozemobacteraceae bacterium]